MLARLLCALQAAVGDGFLTERSGVGSLDHAARVKEGQMRLQHGFLQVQQTCSVCQGMGQVIKDPCPDCRGQGLSTQVGPDNQMWKINVQYDPFTGFTFMMAKKLSFSQRIEHQLKDSVVIMMLAYPLLGLLIWVVVRRGLDTQKKVTDEVRHRAPGYLESVDLERVPLEVQPLVIESPGLSSKG